MRDWRNRQKKLRRLLPLLRQLYLQNRIKITETYTLAFLVGVVYKLKILRGALRRMWINIMSRGTCKQSKYYFAHCWCILTSSHAPDKCFWQRNYSRGSYSALVEKHLWRVLCKWNSILWLMKSPFSERTLYM